MLPYETQLQRLQFYVTTPYPCGYLEDREARSLIATPPHLIDAEVYGELIRHGFRRSGKFTYRPQCESCQACIPVRLPVERFMPGRSQRRAWLKHRELTTHIVELQFSEEHFALYRAYQKTRHPGGGMDADDAEQYRNFLAQSNVETVLVEFREDGELRMVSVVDCVGDGLSAVYTFYDCSDAANSYGTYNVLWLADWCRRLQLPYLYLGYWVAGSRKMAYKINFRPLEGLTHGQWQALGKNFRTG
jgi:arginine-tRNA-protein transferase